MNNSNINRYGLRLLIDNYLFSIIKMMNNKELEFAVFCIENTAEYLELKGDDVYKLLTEKSDILDNYIIPCFDALHTQGKEYIVNDIVEIMREKGLAK